MKDSREDDQRNLIAQAFTCSLQGEGKKKSEDFFPKRRKKRAEGTLLRGDSALLKHGMELLFKKLSVSRI